MKRALFIGRFQPFHIGHLSAIKWIAADYDEVIIAIGSSSEKGTAANPFSLRERRIMVKAALSEAGIKNCRIFAVPDFYYDKKWIGYIKDALPKFDAMITGNNTTERCFTRFGYRTKKVRLAKGVSSTIVRERMLRGDWQKLVPKAVAIYLKKIKGVEKVRGIYGNKASL